MGPGSGRPFREQRHRLRVAELAGNSLSLLRSAAAVIAPNVKCVVLVSHPMDQRVPELRFRNECATGRTGEHENIKPAGMVADQQGVRRARAALGANASTANPCRRAKKASRPVRAPEQSFRQDMERNADGKQQDKCRNPNRGDDVGTVTGCG